MTKLAPTLYAEIQARSEGEYGDEVCAVFREENLELTWRALAQRASAAAVEVLRVVDHPGDIVFLASHNSSKLLATFLGIQGAGCIPSILAPARDGGSFVRALLPKLTQSGSRTLFLDPSVRERDRLLIEAELRPAGVRVCELGAPSRCLGSADSSARCTIEGKRASLAFIQYTSGSTLHPRGVRVTHEGLLANCRSMARAIELTRGDVLVSWLPLFHDMGLVGSTAFPLFAGARVVMSDPARFLKNPLSWLRLISSERGTVTVAPHFAYVVSAMRISETKPPEGLDLSQLRVAFNGAEPIRRSDVEEFARKTAPFGFRRSAIRNVYGLAEFTLAATCPRRREDYVYVRASAARLERDGRFTEATHGEAARDIISVGVALPDHEMRITNEHTADVLPEDIVGEIELRGPSRTPGYLGTETPVGSWLKTGDLGFLHDGELFVVGRRKELIKVAGRSVFPTDVENVAGEIPGIRSGGVAAFQIERGRGEAVGVMVEAASSGVASSSSLAREVIRRLGETLDVVPGAVWVVPPRSIPRTTSGKKKRVELSLRAARGELGDPTPAGREEGSAPANGIYRIVVDTIARHVPGMASPTLDSRLSELGFDSLAVVTLMTELEARLGLTPGSGENPRFDRLEDVLRYLEGRCSSMTPLHDSKHDDELAAIVDALRARSLTAVAKALTGSFEQRAAIFGAAKCWIEQIERPLHGASLLGGSASRGPIAVGTRKYGDVVRFGTNHYLGLHRHSEVIAAARRATDTHGTGSGTSAFSGGYSDLHHELERALTEFVGKEAGLIFPTGYTANVGVVSALVGPGDAVVLDRESHASLIDGARLSGAAVHLFRHNDAIDLSTVLGRAHGHARLVVLESVYSMGGPDADIGPVCDVAHRGDALVLLDESHAFGFYGRAGIGLSEAQDVLGSVDLYMTTLSKSLASVGGFVAGRKAFLDLIRHSSRPLMFQACAPPSSVAAAFAALDLIRQGVGREMLWRNTAQLREGIAQLGFRTSGSSPIVPVHLGEAELARAAASQLFDSGIFAPAMVFPAVAAGDARLRFTVTAAHDASDIARALAALGALKESIGTTAQVRPGGVGVPVGDEEPVTSMFQSLEIEGPRNVLSRVRPTPKGLLDVIASGQVRARGRQADLAAFLDPASANAVLTTRPEAAA